MTGKTTKYMGTDTLTFDINPNLFDLKEIDSYPVIKLLHYQHREPKN
jgi:hypothetical protein